MNSGGEVARPRLPEHVNLGLAIDIRKDEGTRQLLVPCVKATEQMDFRQFWMAYEEIVRKASGTCARTCWKRPGSVSMSGAALGAVRGPQGFRSFR